MAPNLGEGINEILDDLEIGKSRHDASFDFTLKFNSLEKARKAKSNQDHVSDKFSMLKGSRGRIVVYFIRETD
jgi:hypothetical protein